MTFKSAAKKKVIKLRQKGKTYKEIQKISGINIPKSTISYWCKNVVLPPTYKKRLKEIICINNKRAREKALEVKKWQRNKRLEEIFNQNIHLQNTIKEKDVAKIALAMLYLGEGSKTRKGSIMFGNSNSLVISLFLQLLRRCYKIDEKKFRCTVQCRADQNPPDLEKYWSHITKIPLKQFYKTRIDPRTIGKPSKKADYRGVCRIDYFSANILIELIQIINILTLGM